MHKIRAGCDPLVKESPRVCLYVQGFSVRSVTNPARTLFYTIPQPIGNGKPH
jgi:hypothetical protein